MRAFAKRLWMDPNGAGAIEFALSAGVLVILMVGILQIGILFMANAGRRNAVGEGARYSTISPVPSDTAIIGKINAKRFGLNSSYITGPTVTHGTENGASYTEVSMGYTVPLNFAFVTMPVTLTQRRRAFAQ